MAASQSTLRGFGGSGKRSVHVAGSMSMYPFALA
jgi:hypothetical protein